MKASYRKYLLHFKREAKTSRGSLNQKEIFLLRIENENSIGYGECSIFRGLSIDDVVEYEQKLQWVCDHIHLGEDTLLNELIRFPSIFFGVEQAFLSLNSTNGFDLFPSDFTDSKDRIPINGLIWMGESSFVKQQIEDRIKEGFNTIKMKVGALDFRSELSIIQLVRDQYSAEDITLRLDANGAFHPETARIKLDELAKFDIHSIEQPIKKHQHKQMALLCKNSPIPIALDEELIGVFEKNKKQELLEQIKPAHIILKPSLHGGIKGCEEWIEIAENQHIDWWVTSALESNLGLNAIAQWTYSLNKQGTHGLGTGSLFTNNFESPLEVKKGNLTIKQENCWQPSNLDQLFLLDC